jgi:hypothetical protein
MEAEIEDFIEGFNQPTFRGMRINGTRSLRGRVTTDGAGCEILFEVYQRRSLHRAGCKAQWRVIEIECRWRHLRSAGLSSSSRS